MRKLGGILATVATALCATFLGSGTAYASTLRIDDIQYGVKKPTSLGECRNQGGTCTLSAGKTVSATITASVGVSFGALNASLGGQYQEQYTVTNGCTSRTLGPGEVYVMFPRGDFVFFNVDGSKGTAFLPTGIFCEIHSDWR